MFIVRFLTKPAYGPCKVDLLLKQNTLWDRSCKCIWQNKYYRYEMGEYKRVTEHA